MANTKNKTKNKATNSKVKKSSVSSVKNKDNDKIKNPPIAVQIVGGLITMAIMIWIFDLVGLIDLRSANAPTLELSWAKETSDKHYTLEKGNSTLYIKTGLDDRDNKKTKVTVDGVQAEACSSFFDSCDFKINFSDVGGERFNHEFRIAASNDGGTDNVYLKIIESSYNSNTESDKKDSLEETKKLVAHLVCQNYIKQYFYPNSVKIHNILGVGRDYAYGESWIYGVDVTVKSSAGGETMYKATCGVAKWQNLEKGVYDGATGGIISFKVEPY